MKDAHLSIDATCKQKHAKSRGVIKCHLLEVECKAVGNTAKKFVSLHNQSHAQRRKAQAHIIVLFTRAKYMYKVSILSLRPDKQ